MTRKHLYRKLFLQQSCRLQTSNFMKKETPAKALSCEFCEIFKNIYFVEHLQTALSMLNLFHVTDLFLYTLKHQKTSVVRYIERSVVGNGLITFLFTTQKTKFSIKSFFSKYEGNCGFGHIY